MIVLSGADLVLPDRIVSPGTIVIDGDRIVEIQGRSRAADPQSTHFDLYDHYIVPGFIDVHVHGAHGVDVMDGEAGVAHVASHLPRHGTTAFCPTTIACSPEALRTTLNAVRAARTASPAGARVLPAHLESNFINPEYKGAQPLECLRMPGTSSQAGEFTGGDILKEIAAARPDVGILTIAPELDGAIDLIGDLVRLGHHVSLGHSAASYEEGIAGVEAGARQATHLFNRMPPLSHRAPGLAGALLEREEVTVEIVCDGVHVHPAMMRVAIAAKSPAGVMAITDGTAGAGLPRGAVTALGGRRIRVGDAAYLDDGTLSGSVLTMDRAFARLVGVVGLSLVDAATLCATTPARALNLQGFGVLAPGAFADLAVLDRNLAVVHTFVGGTLVWSR